MGCCAFKNEKISFIWNKQVTRVLGEDKVSGIEMTDTVTGEQSTMNITAYLWRLVIVQTPICLKAFCRWKTPDI